MSRALVLSGGGPVGVAWESGLIAGFARGGVDLAAADFLLGTSAGAIVGARLASGADAANLHAPLLARRGAAPDLGPMDVETFGRAMALMAETQSGVRHPAEARRELGALSLAAEVASESRFLEQIGHALAEAADAPWPRANYACTAVDVDDGGFQLWDAAAGVELLAAVASSCSAPGLAPPVTLKARRYMDGGMRSATNADLAAGYDVVVIVSVQPPGAPSWTAQRLDEEVESLKSGGSTVVVITPDDAAGAAFGGDLMDFARDAQVAQAGLVQGLSQAEILKSIWG